MYLRIFPEFLLLCISAHSADAPAHPSFRDESFVGELRRPVAVPARHACDEARAAVFRFLSEDWLPWIALLHMRERGRS
jgi:hypothetical protein